MSDLISRSKLLKEVEKYKFGAISNDAEREYIKKTILDFIICQPTAYDIDRVVKELEENASRYTKKYVTPYGNNGYKDTKAISVHKAIEIVKQGGVADDVCEWHCDEYGRYHTKCHTLADNDPLEYTYCPYCGKNIKVV